MLELYRLKATRLEIRYAIHRFAAWSVTSAGWPSLMAFGRLIRLGLSHWLGWRPFAGSPLPLRAAFGWLAIVAICLVVTAPLSIWFRYLAYWTARHWRWFSPAAILIPAGHSLVWARRRDEGASRRQEAFSVGRLLKRQRCWRWSIFWAG